MAYDGFSRRLVFFVNGKQVADDKPNPEDTLLQYLRVQLGLTGAKLGCGEGGCGSCTVMLSKLNRQTGIVRHYSVNACLTPVVSVHGLSVTTVEGVASVKDRLHPIQEQLAKSNGSQCGFCTPGIVMSMYALLRNNHTPSMLDIEDNLVGNLCRCTGYRPILEGFRRFTAPLPETGCGKDDCCRLNKEPTACCPDTKTQECQQVEIIFPPRLKLMHLDEENVVFEGPHITWFRPTTLGELLRLKNVHSQAKIVVGNTEVGIEMKFKGKIIGLQINPSAVPEMNCFEVTSDAITFGAAMCLTLLEVHLKQLIASGPDGAAGVCVNMLEMLRWFGSKQIRNVATVGGNIMTGSPISDLNPLLLCLAATLRFQNLHVTRDVQMDDKFFESYRQVAIDPSFVLVNISIPFLEKNEHLAVLKQARRRDDDIAIVNTAMRLRYNGKVQHLIMVFGGMSSTTRFAPKAMQAAVGLVWNNDLFDKISSELLEDFPLEPTAPGGMIQYRKTLVVSMFFKFYLSAHNWLSEYGNMDVLTTSEANLLLPYARQAMKSSQYFDEVPKSQADCDGVGRPVGHESGYRHATGEAIYLDDTHSVKFELHAAFVLSHKASAYITAIDPAAALAMEGVHRFFSAKDIPDKLNKAGYLVEDEELFASREVHYVGNIIGLIVADSKRIANKAALRVQVSYDLKEPVLTIEDAIQRNSVWNPIEFKVGDPVSAFENCHMVMHGQIRLGGQEHFYLETQGTIAIPKEGGAMLVLSSSQNPADVQRRVARITEVPEHLVVCTVKRLGGGFGGKETKSGLIAAYVALAASRMNRPVRLILDRADDMAITGARHPFYAQWKVGYQKDGLLKSLQVDFHASGGYSQDISDAMAGKAILHLDNTYKIPNVKVKGTICRTNYASNTACRGTGSPQVMLMMEDIMNRIATTLDIPLYKMQEKNLYDTHNQRSYYGQLFETCPIRQCWQQLLTKSNYEQRRTHVLKFNKENKYVKRGISIVPTKMACSFGCGASEQGAALVMAYRDGTVLLTHGGVEVGQGLHTRMIQAASRELQIPMHHIHISETSTDKVPNATATAASASSDLNGMAVKECCRKLNDRLEPYKIKNPQGSFKEWVEAAYNDRVSLSATGFYRTPGLTDFQFQLNGGNFYSYYTFGAAVSEVQVDVLTGSHTILRTDIVMDAGSSVNPALDIGQIEGAFTFGCGLYTLEEMVYSPQGDLLTKGPGNYKLMSVQDVPMEFNVSLINASDNAKGLYSSRALGEPPLNLAASVFLAIKDAIQDYRNDAKAFRLDSPATVERIRMACRDNITQKVDQQSPLNGVVTRL